jgi:hypothetical protein
VPDLDHHLRHSHKLEFGDLDWALAARHGITPRERRALGYFADIESQTVYYMMEVVKTGAARDHDLLGFLTLWNYEEYFHGLAMARFLKAVGVEVRSSEEVHANSRFRARVEEAVELAIAKTMPGTFIALWQTWGAAAELLTTMAYEELARTTANPVLSELCRRIAKQERRHFAWYYEASAEHLAKSRLARKVVRTLFDHAWAPVGASVKTPPEMVDVIEGVYDPGRFEDVCAHVDRRIGALPGMDGVTSAVRWWADMKQKAAAITAPAAAFASSPA